MRPPSANYHSAAFFCQEHIQDALSLTRFFGTALRFVSLGNFSERVL
jgi:hypothetical protein